MTFASQIANVSYPTAIITIVVLTVWSIIHMYTKAFDQAPWTDIHSTISAVLGAALMVQIAGVLHKHSK
jgi:nicotinamide riboside transporter PnuC